MDSQKEKIREAMQAIASRRPGRNKLVYDKTKKTIVAVSSYRLYNNWLEYYGRRSRYVLSTMITIPSEYLNTNWKKLVDNKILPIILSEWDDGDAYSLSSMGIFPSQKEDLWSNSYRGKRN